MRLKEIRDGMLIHCKTVSEVAQLVEYTGANKNYIAISLSEGDEFCFLMENGTIKNWVYLGDISKNVITEFSDLILPELTLGEAWSALGDISDEYLFDYFDVEDKYHARREEIICGAEWSELVDLVNQWKSDHEKKEPEIETVDICRIIEIMPDGKKRCVHEEDINPDEWMEFNGLVEGILKCYCMEHKGEFIAVHEVVSRVKKV